MQLKQFPLLIPLLLVSLPALAQTNRLTEVATSLYQWSGIALSQEDRLFVSFPSLHDMSPLKLGEIIEGREYLYPNREDHDRFICIQKIVIDSRNRLFILDSANPKRLGVDPSGAKLFQVNLHHNRIEKTYYFPSSIAPPNSVLADLRIDARRQFAYLSESQQGGIIALDLRTGDSWIALDQSVTAVRASLDSIRFTSTGVWHNRIHTHGIELSADGKTLYFAPLTGTDIYAIPTILLRDRHLSPAQRSTQIQALTHTLPPTCALWRHKNYLMMSDLSRESVQIFDLRTHQSTTLHLPSPIRWANSFAQDSFGRIYFTTAQINYPSDKRTKYQIWRLALNY